VEWRGAGYVGGTPRLLRCTDMQIHASVYLFTFDVFLSYAHPLTHSVSCIEEFNKLWNGAALDTVFIYL